MVNYLTKIFIRSDGVCFRLSTADVIPMNTTLQTLNKYKNKLIFYHKGKGG